MNAHRIIIDCDPGIDDAVSLLLALASPEVELLGVTTVCGNIPVDATTRNALTICHLAGRDDIPVYSGAFRPLLRDPIMAEFSGSTGLGNVKLEEPTHGAEALHAVNYLVKTLTEAGERGEKITLCAHGPLTNLALMFRHSPAVAAGIERIVLMGGAFRAGGNRTRTAEFNMLADPHAAAIVFSAGVPVTMLPLDATFQAMATPERVEKIRAVPGKVAQAVADVLTFWDRKDLKRYGSLGGPLHDPLVPAYVIRPDLFTIESTFVEVEWRSELCFGQTVADWYGRTDKPHNADVVLGVNAEGFFDLLTERLASYGR